MATLTSRSLVTTVIGLLALMLAAAVLAPAAQAAESASDVEFLDEGWWLRFREPLEPVPPGSTVGLPDDATEIPRATLRDQTNPYKGEYTRVGAYPGEEGDEAMAGFGFDLFTLGETGEAKVTGGTVTFVAAPRESAPQAGDGANGQRNEEAAAMVACPTSAPVIADFAGNWEDKPEYDCEAASSPLEPIDPVNERPAWQMDLAPLAAAWGDTTTGFVVVPDPEREPDSQVFHVAFPSSLNANIDLEKFPPPTADITYEVEEFDIPTFDDPAGFGDEGGDAAGFGDGDDAGFGDDSSFDDGGSSGGSGGFSNGGGSSSSGSSGDFGGADAPVAAGGDEQADAPDVAEEELEEDDSLAGAAETPLAADAEETGGTNLAYLLVPLLGLGLAGTLGYSLSKEPELAAEHEGAVSKLMQRRQQGQGALGAPRDA